MSPGVTIAHFCMPAEELRISNGLLDMLVRVSSPRHASFLSGSAMTTVFLFTIRHHTLVTLLSLLTRVNKKGSDLSSAAA